MLRFVIRRDTRTVGGATFSAIVTVDADLPKLESILSSGGYGEDSHEVCQLIGVEVLSATNEGADHGE